MTTNCANYLINPAPSFITRENKTLFMTQCALDAVGNTPVVSLTIDGLPNVNLFGKLEYYNPTGSVKDRAASFILKKCLEEGTITRDTTIIESSSGNFGIALSAFCSKLGLSFICVIDPNISPVNEMIIASFGARLVKVRKTDENGGYLLTRIKKVKELQREIKNSYWVNQYANPLNAMAYRESLGNELVNAIPGKIDYVFTGVSSGGTITGLSQKIKEKNPATKVIAVDIFGSVIFGGTPAKRYIPGIGSSMAPDILKSAFIDEVVYVSELDTVYNCRELLRKYFIFAGGSSGSVLAGVKKYFYQHDIAQPFNVVCLFPDRGDRYFSTIYNDSWVREALMPDTVLPVPPSYNFHFA
jgi:2,3-diaminopropionate biosynthesis protein SbnA